MATFNFTTQMLHVGRWLQVNLPDQSFSLTTEQPIVTTEHMPWREGLEATTAWLMAQGHSVDNACRHRRSPLTGRPRPTYPHTQNEEKPQMNAHAELVVEAAIHMLADALYPHRNDWWEDASERDNLRHRAEVTAALDVARSLGWTPTA